MSVKIPEAADVDRGWAWVVLGATFVSFMLQGTLLYCTGLAHLALLRQFGEPVAKTVWVVALFAALMSMTGPLSSFVINRFSCRIAIFLAAILMCAGCLATAFSPNIAWCILTFGVISGTGAGVGYNANITVVELNFRKFRNVAMGIAVSGAGIGVFIFSPTIQAAREFYGFSGFFIILAGISIQECVCAALCKPSSLEIEGRNKNVNGQGHEFSTYRESFKYFIKIYSNKALLCFSFSMLIYAIGTYMLFIHLPSYSVHTGFSSMQSAWLLSICGVSTVLSRILTSVAASHQNVDELVLYTCSFGTLALGTFLFPLYSKTYGGQIAFAAMLGTYFGGCHSIMNSINAKIVGSDNLTIATGMEYFFCGIGIIIGPVVAGLIVDNGGTYEQSFMVAAFCILMGAAIGMATVLFQPETSDSALNDIDIIVESTGEITIIDKKTDNPSGSTMLAGNEDYTNCKDIEEDDRRHTKSTLCANQDEVVDKMTKSVSFGEEIEKLLMGEDIKYIDES